MRHLLTRAARALRAPVSLLALLSAVMVQAETVRLQPDRVFDGNKVHDNWVVIVEDERIRYAGPASNRPREPVDRILRLAGQTLLPGLIEGHSHILLHPYNETPWNDQVLKESQAERVVRAVNHARDTLMAGVTTMRDLGAEGAGYADVSVRNAIREGLIPGPRLIVAGPAIVATGSYGPKGFHEGVSVPLGAETADGYDDLVRVTRRQIGGDIDFVKVYADYRWGPGGTAAPTFTQEEIETVVEVAKSSGRTVAAHAATAEAIRRAVNAGVATIEHGDGATPEVLRLMKEKNVALCPTLAAGDAISQYRGWSKGSEPEPARITAKRESFKAALASGVAICFGGDVGVYPHGDNVRELELMVEYGMDRRAALHAATAGNAKIFGLSDVGRVASGAIADLIAVRGNPLDELADLRRISLVMQGGEVVRLEAAQQ